LAIIYRAMEIRARLVQARENDSAGTPAIPLPIAPVTTAKMKPNAAPPSKAFGNISMTNLLLYEVDEIEFRYINIGW
jgi:hypothetical protein